MTVDKAIFVTLFRGLPYSGHPGYVNFKFTMGTRASGNIYFLNINERVYLKNNLYVHSTLLNVHPGAQDMESFLNCVVNLLRLKGKLWRTI